LIGDGPGCDNGGTCFWEHQDFNGDKRRIEDVPCCDWFSFSSGFTYKSAKNRYGNRKVQTANGSFQTSCMDPDENRPSLDISDRFKVGVLGSRCG
jgi:hypothetical protein